MIEEVQPESFFYKYYYKYFLWNEGLINHYFSPENKEILLYADKSLMKTIGQKVGIVADDYKEDFLSSVECFCANYNKYICPQNDPNWDKVCGHNDCKYNTNIYCLKANRRDDVLAVANHIYSSDIKYYSKYETAEGSIKIETSEDKKPIIHKLPYFAIVIYVIMKFDNGNTQEWCNVGDGISQKSREYIKELWRRISNYDGRFDPNASAYDNTNYEFEDYAGRILYHLPLSASTRNKIQDAIYKSSVWKSIDSKSFFDILGLIMQSLKDVKANDELKEILLKCFSSNDYKGIAIRKIQSVIDEFDIDAYEGKIAERSTCSDYSQTEISGEFALGLYFPVNEVENNSIVLLTTVQQHVEANNFIIEKGLSGTLAGYNTSFVKYGNSKSVSLKDYSIKTNTCNIKPLPCGDVIFFYNYDESLFIQTREIHGAKSYIIAVRDRSVEKFLSWCKDNCNKVGDPWPTDDTKDLFGSEWIIYYHDGKLNGQYYQKEQTDNNTTDESAIVVMIGGIKKSSDTYFINALPYFEIPQKYMINKVNLYLNYNGKVYSDYGKKISGRKLIVDFKGMPIRTNETGYVDICLECDASNKFIFSIKVCGQAIQYDTDTFYHYDRFGRICDHEEYFDDEVRNNKVTGLFPILSKERFDSITDDFYSINLLAACCFNNDTSEITRDKFRKCISYAATLLNVDIQRNGFISNVKKELTYAGILNTNYLTGNCQAIEPFFTRVPFSVYQTNGSQLFMLSGCYTRAFIADLFDYCTDNGIEMYLVRGKEHDNENKLLPPIILLSHKFNPNDFRERYSHMFSVLDDYDFALSLLYRIPEYDSIRSLFKFEHNDSVIPLLDEPLTDSFPRIRTMGEGYQKRWFVEKQNNMLSEIAKGLVAWANIYCHHEQCVPMVIKNRDNSVFLPSTLYLPNYVQRALYLMNLGLPEKHKVFVCGIGGNSYYIVMNKYKLNSPERCKVLASKITGEMAENKSLVRDNLNTDYKMEYWKQKINGNRYSAKYLVLYEKKSQDILAVAYKQNVYVNCSNSFRKVESDSINNTISFLVKESWSFSDQKSIGYSKQGGLIFEKKFDITNDIVELPNKNDFDIETIQIV